MSTRCDYYLYCWVELRSFSDENCYFFFLLSHIYLWAFSCISIFIMTKINVPNVFKSEYFGFLFISLPIYLFLTASSLAQSRGGGTGALSPQYPWAKYQVYFSSALTVYWHHPAHLSPFCPQSASPRTISHLALFLGCFNFSASLQRSRLL